MDDAMSGQKNVTYYRTVYWNTSCHYLPPGITSLFAVILKKLLEIVLFGASIQILCIILSKLKLICEWNLKRT